jgi:hypothetical protein
MDIKGGRVMTKMLHHSVHFVFFLRITQAATQKEQEVQNSDTAGWIFYTKLVGYNDVSDEFFDRLFAYNDWLIQCVLVTDTNSC